MMRVEQKRMTCFECGHVFEAETLVNAPFEVAIAAMKAIRCPSCGAGDVGFGGEYGDAPPPTAPIETRVAWWFARGATGISSETIALTMQGQAKGGPFGADAPHDPADFHRCRRLFEIVPEWRSQLSKVTALYPWFRPFEEAWDEFDRLFDEESPSGRCPKLFAAMSKAMNEVYKIRESR